MFRTFALALFVSAVGLFPWQAGAAPKGDIGKFEIVERDVPAERSMISSPPIRFRGHAEPPSGFRRLSPDEFMAELSSSPSWTDVLRLPARIKVLFSSRPTGADIFLDGAKVAESNVMAKVSPSFIPNVQIAWPSGRGCGFRQLTIVLKEPGSSGHITRDSSMEIFCDEEKAVKSAAR